MDPAQWPRVAIESPYRGDRRLNDEFARNVCRYAIRQERNPYAMHLFFPQFLDDESDEEREMGIGCGLAWTDLAQEVWFCLRPGERLSGGMRVALDHHARADRHPLMRYLYFDQDGELIERVERERMVQFG